MQIYMCIIFTFILIFLGIIIYLLFNNHNNIGSTDIYRKIDKYTDKNYKTELNKMISYYTIYHVDAKYGESFNSHKAILDDVPIAELSELKDDIVKSIIEAFSDNMKLYLFTTYTERWVIDFINISVLSLLINYTSLTIKSIVNLK